MGPAYIKLGQALSIRPDILSPSAMTELQKLCDKVIANLWVSPYLITFIYDVTALVLCKKLTSSTKTVASSSVCVFFFKVLRDNYC